ncbi:hypothetical protein C8R43DRAFT_1137975 [Mycena crocata]|nr:hypothetical protein C8R43DRAFT_1137975 [Mycena crocata]
MPKAVKTKKIKGSKGTSLLITTFRGFQPKWLANDSAGVNLQELEISFKTMEHVITCSRANDVAEVLKRTPNVKKLTLGFSGHMNTYADCLGEPLMAALCALKGLEEFTHKAMTARATEIGFGNLVRLVSSWPQLRMLHIAGSLDSRGCDPKTLPRVTCALQHVVLETCTTHLDLLPLLFAGAAAAGSLKTLEAWTTGLGSLDTPLLPLLPTLESLVLGGVAHPSPAFIRDHLGAAARLHTLKMGGHGDREGRVRAALTTALSGPGALQGLTTATPLPPPSATATGRARRTTTAASTRASTATEREGRDVLLLFPALKHLGYPALECERAGVGAAKENDGAVAVVSGVRSGEHTHTRRPSGEHSHTHTRRPSSDQRTANAEYTGGNGSGKDHALTNGKDYARTNGKEHTHTHVWDTINVGEAELRAVAAARGIRAERAGDLGYRGDGRLRANAVEGCNRPRERGK